MPEEDLDFPWLAAAASKVPGCKIGAPAEPEVQADYLTWTLECCKHAQVVTRFPPLTCTMLEQAAYSHSEPPALALQTLQHLAPPAVQ